MTESSKNEFRITPLPYLNSVDVFESVADEPWALFFDSGVTQAESSKSARFDILAIEPEATLVYDGQATHFRNSRLDQKLYGDPMAILQSALPDCDEAIKAPYLPGAYGYFSYDLARQYEVIPNLADDDEQLPQMAVGIYSVVLVVDHKRKKSKIIRYGDAPSAQSVEQRWMDVVLSHQERLVERELQSMAREQGAFDQSLSIESLQGEELTESLDWKQYQLAFANIKQYIVDGDCYQVNLTKRFSAKVKSDAWNAYKSLRSASPAPYGCFLNLPFAQVLSNSPESFIQCRDRRVVTSPIKGTRPRDHEDPIADLEIAESLRRSAKDRAENLMIVDLMRNDLSRACELGSVKVPELFELHSFANVHHLISKVTGTLREQLHVLDLLRVCFPGGSITGAPKIRSMEIIEEVEPYRRGLYCGSVGYVGIDGNLETNIAIRTIVIKDGIARFSAGGGLVIDSDVQDEYQELNDKASMMSAAVFS